MSGPTQLMIDFSKPLGLLPGAAGVEMAYARRSDPGTSLEAADSIDHGHLTKLRRRILKALAALGGSATAEELCDRTGIAWNTLTPRLHPMALMGAIEHSGEFRRARSGRRQIVWRLCEETSALAARKGNP